MSWNRYLLLHSSYFPVLPQLASRLVFLALQNRTLAFVYGTSCSCVVQASIRGNIVFTAGKMIGTHTHRCLILSFINQSSGWMKCHLDRSEKFPGFLVKLVMGWVFFAGTPCTTCSDLSSLLWLAAVRQLLQGKIKSMFFVPQARCDCARYCLTQKKVSWCLKLLSSSVFPSLFSML